MRMNKKIPLLLSLLLSLSVATAKVKGDIKHSVQLRLIDSFLSGHHYQKSPLDDQKSEEVLSQYLEILDISKSFFTQIDIDDFKQYQHHLDDAAHRGDLAPIYDIYQRYVEKRQQHIAWVFKRLKQPFRENVGEVLELDYKKIDWAKSQQALQKRWEKRLLNEWIVLRLSKQSDEKAKKTLIKRYQNLQKYLEDSKSDDVFQIFANAITRTYDPHTSYFSPRTGEDFDINMKLSLEGIGAQLSLEDDVIVVKELIAGGPAMKSGKLHRNDKILAVAQGDDGEFEDVVGWRLDDSVRLIRGKRGTVIRLRLEKADSGDIIEIRLIRDKIKLEESAAKSEIKGIEKAGKIYRIGIITLPSFYIDFEAANRGDENYRSTTRDVKKLIEQLQKQPIDGLMLDLRNNGGGSLAEAVSLTGLFLDSGPVVQVRDVREGIKVYKDEDGKTSYKGPLAVLINENSASASEIFAAAIKDYGRGIILGEPSYGKGTVQTIIGLNKFVPAISEKIGKLKMTIAMFYRINGSSTQIKGVKPDLYIPNKESYREGGESEEKHALPWHQIAANDYPYFNQVSGVLKPLQYRYDRANAHNPIMSNLLSMMAWNKKQLEDTKISLNLLKRKARKKQIRQQSLSFQNAFRKAYGYPVLDKNYWEKAEKDKTDQELKDEKQYKVDPVLHIATDTVADYIHLLTAQTKKEGKNEQ